MTRRAPIYPDPLKPGDTIGVIAPSSIHDVNMLTPATEFLESKGFKVEIHPQASMTHGQFAGTPEDKAKAIHDYFENPDIRAIFCTRGGNGAVHLLDKLDYDLIARNPKIFIGFSDITALLHAMNVKTGLITYHGPVLACLSRPNPANRIESRWVDHMLGVLTGQEYTLDIGGDKDIEAEGTIYGGNLSVFQTLIGTPYAPDMDKAILFLEDCNDHLSRYDRMCGHLKQAGWFDNLSAVLIGEFLQTQDNPERPFGFTIEEIIREKAPQVPCLTGVPIGHGLKLCTLPIGAKAILKNGTLSFKSP
jgi:muramoyltetrapeptide carboxypeptidase